MMKRYKPPNIKKTLESTEIISLAKDLNELPLQKRKYIKHKKINKNIADDNTIIKTEAKKRGRKKGRTKKTIDLTFKPDEVLDYIIRNYPHIGIERIRDKVINGLNEMKIMGDNPYLLYKFTYEGTKYYYDDKNAIFNTDSKIVGYFIKQPDGNNKMYPILKKNKDTRTFQEVINSIENK